MRNATVRAVNRLTTRWAAQAPASAPGTVMAAAGVWPLLALLADGAAGPARAELEEALGIPPEGAAAAARELLAALAGVRGLKAATGLWTEAGLPLEEDWSAKLPAGARGRLTGDPGTDAEALDAWASDRTGGLIEHMPVSLDKGSLLVLASALTLRLRWIQPFEEAYGEPCAGPWADRPVRMLRRRTSLLDRVRVAHGPSGTVTLLEVVGAAGVDVHLALGEAEAPLGDTLTTAIGAVTRALPATGASLLPDGSPGPGLAVGTVTAHSPEPRLDIETAAFEVRSDQDLLDHARLFGLEAATDRGHGHFPGISSRPLAIASARQSALARFHAEGFEAAAVTAVEAAVGCAPTLPRPRYRARRAEVCFDRPFGFLIVHRTSRLVLAAGWVAEPETETEPEAR
ncbi:serpin family protein [Streptomyces sp. WM6368]|uniref:serpin family protein n=1 Tax=Streptomyces sp. WM6368 TaxID=1415554 RepID=UPI0006B036FB|nr:serpin family protein [Streptomyces sp. WM6368]KOU22682.1 proteinase inhibitor I4 serpin [Streptomyces sp. WM6368]